MPFTLNTPRGTYTLSLSAAPEADAGDAVLTVAMERSDGIEKVALRCRIAKALAEGMSADAIMGRLVPWIERDFEMIRENALKSIRGERKLMEIAFDASNRGPF